MPFAFGWVAGSDFFTFAVLGMGKVECRFVSGGVVCAPGSLIVALRPPDPHPAAHSSLPSPPRQPQSTTLPGPDLPLGPGP